MFIEINTKKEMLAFKMRLALYGFPVKGLGGCGGYRFANGEWEKLYNTVNLQEAARSWNEEVASFCC